MTTSYARLNVFNVHVAEQVKATFEGQLNHVIRHIQAQLPKQGTVSPENL